MASPIIFMPKGFTLLEALIVLALLITCAALGLFISFSGYRESETRDEREIIVAVLEKARSQAMANLCISSACSGGSAHGVSFSDAGRYVIFEGDEYAARHEDVDELIEARDAAVVLSGCNEVDFAARTGDAICTGGSGIRVTDGTGTVWNILLSEYGRISSFP
jgi:Tfp pilus assembly protein FimT